MTIETDAIYHPIPQAPVASNPVLDLDDDEAEQHVSSNESIDATVRWIHFILGCSVLLPWNAMITATPYFLSRLAGSPLKNTFSSYLSITFTASNFGFLAHATITAKQSNSSRRVFLGTSHIAVLTLLLTLSTYTHLPPSTFFTLTLLNGTLQAAAGSYLQTAVVAIASLFGPPAMQAVMSGQAAVGVVVSAVQLLSAVASVRAAKAAKVLGEEYDEGKAEERAAFLFFALSTLFLVATMGAQAYLVRMPAYRRVVQPVESAKIGEEEERTGLIAGRGDGGRSEVEEQDEKGRIWRVAKANVIYEVAVFYVFVVTLAVFPPITTSITPLSPSIHPLLFTSAHFLIFNAGDLSGRLLCSFPRLLVWDPRKLLAGSVLRTLFIPLFLLCNVQRPTSPSPPSVPVVPLHPSLITRAAGALPPLTADLAFLLLLLLFGLSNGYLSSLCMMAAPSLQHNARLKGRRGDVDVAATIASFCLVGGLAVGSAASFLVRGWVCGCNPFRE
ncbi:hypothetical protein BD410DRAFT_757726 [Rickenella mellea]|uniref:Nucleoside transporter n=1 Tax=Rickenella mellea TaxID=50990 RepID=A0A4V3AZH0_9AGAM|nr:hypothetical protein BD410DRAFT_757726 [Rickenella mellea]